MLIIVSKNKWNFVKHQKFHDLPVINDALVFINAKVIHKYELCSNTVFIAEVIDAKINKQGKRSFPIKFLVELFSKSSQGVGLAPQERRFLFAKPFLLRLRLQKKRRQTNRANATATAGRTYKL